MTMIMESVLKGDNSYLRYSCIFSGFQGMHCEVNNDDCVNSMCANESTCIDGINSYKCVCPPTRTGKTEPFITYNNILQHILNVAEVMEIPRPLS